MNQMFWLAGDAIYSYQRRQLFDERDTQLCRSSAMLPQRASEKIQR
jgi:hypothetical protein